MTDYYKLLNIEKTASSDEIQAAIKKARRLWNSRATNPNADIRAEAEQNVRDIAQAEKILLNPSEKEKYDISLSQAPQQSSPVPTSNYVDDSWVEQADRLRNHGDWYSLILFSQNVVNAQPGNALAWCVLGDANYHQGNLSEAENCLKHSISISPIDMAQETLGFLYLDSNRFNEALQCFTEASRISPSTIGYRVERAEVLRILERHDEAVKTAEAAYKEDTSRELSRSIYFSCLHDKILSSISINRSSGRHLITNANQLSLVKQELPKLASIASSDSKERNAVDELRQMVTAAETKKYNDHYGSAIWWIIGMIIPAFTGIGIILSIGIGVAFYVTHFKDGLTWNYLNSSEEVRRTGIQ